MKEKEKKKCYFGMYVVGSIAVAVGMAVVMPRILDYLSDEFYKFPTQSSIDDDDWGPEIVKRTPEKEETEGDDNGEF